MPRISFHMFPARACDRASPEPSGDKNIQNQLRHADPATTRIVYMRGVPEEQKKAVELLSRKAIAG
jgi:integrase